MTRMNNIDNGNDDDDDSRLEDQDRLKKAESECAKVKNENATLRQMIGQLEAESKNDNMTAEAEKARIKEDKLKLRESWHSLKQKTRS
nr:unnamed protein product [Callosobruchus chinensis]